MAKITLADAKKVSKELMLRNIPISALRHGMQVEMEHSDITKGNFKKTAKIALAHLKESPDYYKKLAKMEKTFKKEPNERQKKKSTKIKKSAR